MPDKLKKQDSENYRCDPKELRDHVVTIATEIIRRKSGRSLSFEIVKFNEGILNSLTLYFAREPRFPGSLSKGLLLSGGVGVGKTVLMKAFSSNPLLPFRIVSARVIADMYEKNGSETIATYGFPELNLRLTRFTDYIGICFDDLGTEDTEKSYYGNKTNVLEKIIMNRYDNCPHTLTHFTTNLTGEQMRKLYDARAIDRLREMVNIIEFPTNSKSFRR